MNYVHLIGRLTRDPELRFTGSGKAVVNFGLAVDKSFKTDEADFFDIVAWEKLAETVANYLTKGRQVAVTGRLQSRTWEKDDGSRQKVVEVNAIDVKFLGGSSDGGSAPAPKKNDFDVEAKPKKDDFDVDIEDIDLDDFSQIDDDETPF